MTQRRPSSQGLRSAAQCRRKTEETSPVVVEVAEEMRAVVAEVVDDAKSVTVEVVEETAFVTVDVVDEVNPLPPPLSATGATPVGESVVKNRWNGPLNPGGSPLGAGAGDQTMTWLYCARSNAASGMTSIPRDAAGTKRLLTSGTQKSDAAAGAGGVDGLPGPGDNDAVLVGRGAADGVACLLAGASCRYGEMTSYGESDWAGPTSSFRSCSSGGSKPSTRREGHSGSNLPVPPDQSARVVSLATASIALRSHKNKKVIIASAPPSAAIANS